MSRSFFELYADMYIRGGWQLKSPMNDKGEEVRDWDFRMGAPVHVEGRLRILLENKGRPLDFSETDSRIPVVHIKVASLLAEMAPDDLQLIPVDIEDQPDQYLILVATRNIRCIDEKKSKVQFWQPEDGLPDMIGQYYAVDNLRIDQSTVGEVKLFRPAGWEMSLIVSGDIKEEMERLGTTGMKFEEV
jgi:hypothetical protein